MKKVLVIHGFLLIFAVLILLSSCSIFLPHTITVEIDPVEGGTVTFEPDEKRFKTGDAVTVSAVPNDGFAFSGWSGDVQDPSYTIDLVMDGDKYLTASFVPVEPRVWTLMIYMDGDNNLESEVIADFNNIEGGLANSEFYDRDFVENSYVIALVDRSGMPDGNGFVSSETEQGGGDWTDTRLYRVLPDADSTFFGSERMDDGYLDGYGHLENLGEKNMADAATLTWFIDYARNWFPSENTALIMWNHGGGARSARNLEYTPHPTSSLKEICVDEDNGGGYLILDDVQTAVAAHFSSSEKLPLLGMDACLMGGVEVAYEFRDLVEFMAFSPASEYGGWAYTEILETLTPGTTPEQFAVQAVKAFRDKANTYGLTMNTQTAVDLSGISTLYQKLNLLATALDSAGAKSSIETIRDASTHYYGDDYESIFWPYLEIGDFCTRLENDSIATSEAGDVKTALAACISYAWAGSAMGAYEGSGIPSGLSLFFSRGDLVYDSYSHYAYQGWYSSLDLVTGGGEAAGGIDFAYSDSDGTVETWRELMEKWYDPGDTLTPGSY